MLRIIRQFFKYKINNDIFEVKRREHTIAISILNYHLIFLSYFTFQNSLYNFARILPQKRKTTTNKKKYKNVFQYLHKT